MNVNTYRNGFYRSNRPDQGPELITTDAKPVQIGKYVRYHRIKSSKPSGNCYDFVMNGICFAMRCAPAIEAGIDADEYAQDNLQRLVNAR